jgi:hypothetical protein
LLFVARAVGGHDAIRSWREGVVSKYSYTTEIVGAVQLAPDRVLVLRAAGWRGGSPAEVR